MRIAKFTTLFSGSVLSAWMISSESLAQSSSGSTNTFPLTTMVALSLLALIPFIFLASTSFVKLAFVFSILRNAIGTGQVPSGMIITTLATILTLYVMTPVGNEIYTASFTSLMEINLKNPLANRSLDAIIKSINAGKEPLRRFLKRNASESEIDLFYRLAKRGRSQAKLGEVTREDFMVVLSAFFITELKEAFQIGFLVYIPFLIIDIVVANILLALGMHMVSPTAISLPFKLLLFVWVDGFYLLIKALVLGYQ